ncbi:MAG: LysR substrate-binding domain-containing protein [Magnetospirillum sp.]|nr:LysR substrate-binding domain-containing protein [Magnetospirillum sp.]
MREAVGEGGMLRLGSLETAAAVRLPTLLAAFHQNHPKVTLTLSTGTTEEQMQAVLDRRVDFAFVVGPVRHDRLDGVPVFSEELVLAAPAGIRAVEAANTKAMLVFRSGCAYRVRTEAWLRARGEPPRRIMEFGTLDGLLGCVAAGMGVSLLPRSIVERPQHAGQIVALPIADGQVDTWMIQHRDAVETGAMRAFKAMVTGGRAQAAE